MPALWRAVILLLGITVSIVVFTGAFSTAQPFVVLPFLLLCPGMAWIRLFRLEPGLQELTLAIALSLVLATGVAGGMLYAGAWSPRGSLAVLLVLTLLALVLDVARWKGQRSRGRTSS